MTLFALVLVALAYLPLVALALTVVWRPRDWDLIETTLNHRRAAP